MNSGIELNPAERLVSEQFARVFRAYMEASDEVQKVIKEMCKIIDDDGTDEDDRDAAIATLMEALYPACHNGELGIDIEDFRTIAPDGSEFKEALSEHDEQESTFANNLKTLMAKAGMSQTQLAEKTGVHQPAISMMLNRSCRPQRKTIAKLASALGVSPKDLWPG